MGEKIRGGLAGPKEINLLIDNPLLAEHLYNNYEIYARVADRWKKRFETNDFEDMSEFEKIEIIAVGIGHTNKDTLVRKFAKNNNLDDRLIIELIAKACYESDMKPEIDFPMDLLNYFK